MLRGLQLDPLSEEPRDDSTLLQSRVKKAGAPAQRGKSRKLHQLQLPTQHLALAPTAHAAGGGRLTRSAAADAAAAEVVLGLAGASPLSAPPSHVPSPTVGTLSSLMRPPSTTVSPAVDQGPAATASLPAASRPQSAAVPSLPAMQPSSVASPGQHQAAAARVPPGCRLPVAALLPLHPAGAANADSQMVLATSSAPRGSPPSKALHPPPQGVRHQLDLALPAAALLPSVSLSASASSRLEDLLKDPAAALARFAREAAGLLADVEVPRAPRPHRLPSVQSTPGWRCALTLPCSADDGFQSMRGVGPLPAPAALDSAPHEYSAIPARPMMASDFARFTKGHNALVSHQFSWQPSKPAGPTGHLALPSGLPELMFHYLMALTPWQTKAVLMRLLSLCMTLWQRQSSLPVLPVAALLSCISYHPLYPEGSLTPQMPATLTLSMPQFPGGLQPLVSPCYEPNKCSLPT